MSDTGKNFDAEDLLNKLFKEPNFVEIGNLKGLFEKRLGELGISKTNACEILNIQSRTLNGILEGTQKSVDFTCLIKIASFLQISKEKVINMYIESLEENFSEEVSSPIAPEKIEFIKENFDLAVLKKAGFINNITDFKQVEERIINFFGLKTIYDYKRPPIGAAFSEGKIKPKNELSRSFWIKAAYDSFKAINNPYIYERQNLIDYFPEIRWHSTNTELGLKNVIKSLYKRGITVLYLPSLPSLHLRGATFAVNEKPCIVFTNIAGFYPTLWFAIIHELFHVLFDWDEIRNNSYHLSDEDKDIELLSIKEREDEANDFAREYLFSKEKSSRIRSLIHNQEYIKEFAKNNHVHPSFIYVFNAYDVGVKDRMAWARAKKQSPNIDDSVRFLNNSWENPKTILDFVNTIRTNIYN
ncbi:MAG: hypothetical protein JXB49_18155 [Bacteroidales bacterium]|nr:hypothetical protein [Bacteroidales bacterium]